MQANMAFNIFKKKEEKKPQVSAEKPLEKEKKQSKKEVVKKTTGSTKGKKTSPALSSVLLNPHVTEKAAMLAEKGQYVFRVHKTATKGAVKQSVEALYGVNVKKVGLTTKPARKVGAGKRTVLQPGLKKAVVHLKKGESIEIISR